MLGSLGFATFSHSLQLLTTCENFWERSESRVYSYSGKSWEVRSLLQSKAIPSSALGSCSSTRQSSGPGWCLSAGYVGLLGSTNPRRGWPNTPAHPPRVWGYGFPSLICLLCCCLLWRSKQVWQGAWGSLSQPCSPPPHQGHRNVCRRQLRAGKGNLGLVIPWVKGVAGTWPVSCADLVLLPCSPLLHSLTGHFSRLLDSVR